MLERMRGSWNFLIGCSVIVGIVVALAVYLSNNVGFGYYM